MELEKRVKVIHKKCGGQVGWYLLDIPRCPDIVLSKDFERLDGTSPIDGEKFREKCPTCGDNIFRSIY
jgi:uncharacterized C2H2 Zn-finger protein